MLVEYSAEEEEDKEEEFASSRIFSVSSSDDDDDDYSSLFFIVPLLRALPRPYQDGSLFLVANILGFWIFRSFSFPTKKKRKKEKKEGSLVEHHTRLGGCRGVFFFFTTTTTTTTRRCILAHTHRESLGSSALCARVGKRDLKHSEKRPLHQEESAFSYIFQQTCPTMPGTA